MLKIKKIKENKRQYFQDKKSKLANAEGRCIEKVNITSRENESNMESIEIDSPITDKSDMSKAIVLNPNHSQKSNVVAKNDYKVLCKYCKKEFLSTSLLRHIARTESCKMFYGVEFENLKKQSTSIRKKKDYDKRLAREEEERRKQMAKEEQARKEMNEKKEVTQIDKDIADDVEKVSCDFCKEKYLPSKILMHIGVKKSCKEHYGSKFEEMKKEKLKAKNKEYYNLNQEKIKAYRKKEYVAMKEYIKKKAQEKSEKRHVEFMANYKKTKDENVRQCNDWGLEMARKDLQNGCHIISQCKPSEENKKIMKELEKEIEKTFAEFQTKIEKVFECAKDVNGRKLVKKIYLENSRTISETWHDLRLSTNVKFIEMAKKLGKNYPGNFTCKCYKCQDEIGVKNIKKVHVNNGLPKPTNKTFAYMRQQR